MEFDIAVLPGDGVGREVVPAAVRVLEAVSQKFGHKFNLRYGLIGGQAIEEQGTALHRDTLKMCRNSDAVLMGAVGDPKFDVPDVAVHPSQGLLVIREGLDVFANLRPVKASRWLIDCSSLKPEVLEGVDLVIVREYVGGLYGAKPKREWRTTRGRWAVDSMAYSEHSIERIIRVAFEVARSRRKRLTSLDKIGALASSRLWRQVAIEVAAAYPDVELEHRMIDNCAMELVRHPSNFDAIVVENAIGDVLQDEAAALIGSVGMVPSASLSGPPQQGARVFGLYEPMHGSAPRRAGLNMVNPIATILSVALMLRYSFCLPSEAQAVEKAVDSVLEQGYCTYDIMSDGKKKVGTKEMADLIVRAVQANGIIKT